MVLYEKRTGLCILLACALVWILYNSAVRAAPGLEGVEWHPIEVNGTIVPKLSGGRQPSLRLEGTQKKVTGYSGCNNFFGTYELDGASLKFGPLGATRRACPETETKVETAFLQALERTRGWKIEESSLLLLNDDAVLARFTTGKEDGANADPGSMTYRLKSLSSENVTLVNGEYHAPAAPGSASEIMVKLTDKQAFGTVEEKDAGTVILVVSTGGSGSFFELALLSKTSEGWRNTDTALLGDRVKVHSVAIEDDHIVVAMTVHGPGDPLCCPTVETKKRLAVQGDRLVPEAAEARSEEPRITGRVWQWVRTQYNNDTAAAPPKPSNYTVRFREDGTLDVRADCNQKGGTYSLKGQQVSITITHSTMAMCEEGSLEEQFTGDLSRGTNFFFYKDDLYIDLPYDSGTMRFSATRRD